MKIEMTNEEAAIIRDALLYADAFSITAESETLGKFIDIIMENLNGKE